MLSCLYVSLPDNLLLQCEMPSKHV
uniref:Uncharacterized protein n=1 Tax=Anguilla anguilla TaxID=7936 RepID=A0A0E9RCG1_ANGAN